MENIDIAYLIILSACAICSYQMGRKDGIGITLDYMRDQGHIDFED
jgi:hypothetical protein